MTPANPRAMPKILGILNVTPDSFSDGGCFVEPETALQHARRLHAAGACAIDVGAASSHPDAEVISPETELARLRPVVERVFDARVEDETRDELLALVKETYATHARLRQSMADVRQRLRLKVNEAYGRMLGIEPPRV